MNSEKHTNLDAVELEPTAEVPAWEEIAPGRYMPRRIRGSCHGRVLGWTFLVPPGPGESEDQQSEK